MPSRTPTMRDVAQMAGVSIQTVSCVVNDKGSISAETRHRVLQAIETLNYRRDPIARSMRTRQTHLIGLLVLDITNPVLSVIASAVEGLAYADNYNVVLYNVGQDARREQTFVETAIERRVDGLIIVNAVDRDRTLSLVKARQIPTVLIDSIATPTIPSVSADNIRGAYLATRHLIELGHQRIAHISGSLELEVARHRKRGYGKALDEHSLAYQQTIIPKGKRWAYQDGYDAMCQLLENTPLPTAVFAASDQMAIGAYRALHEAGLSVPTDISVVGFDDIEAAAFVSPQLTTIRQPFVEIASRAVSLLLQLVGGRYPDSPQVILPPELVIRHSTAKPPEGKILG